jgi:hypothetical protein
MPCLQRVLEISAAVSAVLAGIFFLLEKYQSQDSVGVRRAVERFWNRISLDSWQRKAKLSLVV